MGSKRAFIKILVYSIIACLVVAAGLIILSSPQSTGLAVLSSQNPAEKSPEINSNSSLQQNPIPSGISLEEKPLNESKPKQSSSGSFSSNGTGGFSAAGSSGSSGSSQSQNNTQPAGAGNSKPEKTFTASFSPSTEEISITEGESINFSASANSDANYSWVLDGMEIETGKKFVFRTALGFEGEYNLTAFIKFGAVEKFKAWKITVSEKQIASENGRAAGANSAVALISKANALKKIHSSLKQSLLSSPSAEQTVIFTVESGKASEMLALLNSNGILDANIIPPGVLIVAKAKPSSLEQIAENSSVSFVNPNFTYYAMESESQISPNILQVNAPELWAKKLNDENITGKGVPIAILDTGVNSRNAYLGYRVGLKNVYNGFSEDFDYLTGSFGTGHGSHVAGIAAGGRSGTKVDYNANYLINDGSAASLLSSKIMIVDNFETIASRVFENGSFSLSSLQVKSGYNSLKCDLSGAQLCSTFIPSNVGLGFYAATLPSDGSLDLWVYFSNTSSLQEINVLIGKDSNNYRLYKKTGAELPSSNGWFLADFNLNLPFSTQGTLNAGDSLNYKKVQTVYSSNVTTSNFFDYLIIYPSYCVHNLSSGNLECSQIHDVNSLGIAPDANIWNITVMNTSGSGNSATIATAMAWAVENNAKILNLSLGSNVNNPGDPIVQEMKALHDAGYEASFIVSAGNCGNETPDGSCGAYRGITTPGISADAITVAAVDSSNQKAGFSSSGENASGKPDITAPGVSINSAFLASPYYYTTESTAVMSGTSMSAPHVSGAVALILQAKPSLKWQEVKNLLLWNAKDLGPAGFDVNYGYGMLDLNALFNSRLEIMPRQAQGQVKAGFAFNETILLGNAGFSEDINNISASAGDANIKVILGKTSLSGGESARLEISIDSSNGKIPTGDFNSWIDVSSSKGSKRIPVNIAVLPNPPPTALLVKPKNPGDKLRNQAKIDFNFSNDEFLEDSTRGRIYYSSIKGARENLAKDFNISTALRIESLDSLNGTFAISGWGIISLEKTDKKQGNAATRITNSTGFAQPVYFGKNLDSNLDLTAFSNGGISVWANFSTINGPTFVWIELFTDSRTNRLVCPLSSWSVGWKKYNINFAGCWPEKNFSFSRVNGFSFNVNNEIANGGSVLMDDLAVFKAENCAQFDFNPDKNYSCSIDLNTLPIPSGNHFIDLEVCDTYSCSTDSTDGNVFVNFAFSPDQNFIALSETQNSMLFSAQGIEAGELGNGIDINWFADGIQKAFALDFNALARDFNSGTHDINAVITDSKDSYSGENFIMKKAWVFTVEKNPPVTVSDANNNWQNFNANVKLSCTDINGSGCALTQYRIDTDASNSISFGAWQNYSSPILFSADGNFALDFNSTDNAGNAEITKTKFVLIDKTPPSGTALSFEAITPNSITSIVSGAADLLSGLNNLPYWFDSDSSARNSGWAAGNWIDSGLSPNTLHSYKVKSRDAANNESVFTASQSKFTLANNPIIQYINCTFNSCLVSVDLNSNPSGTFYSIEETSGNPGSSNSEWINAPSPFTDSGLSFGMQYCYKVKARNNDSVETGFSGINCKSTQVSSPENGVLKGKITIRPICPVEIFPPDPACQPTLQTYLAYPFNVYQESMKVAEFHGDAEGNYGIELPAGSYIIKQETGVEEISEIMLVEAGKEATLNFNIDTGIR